MVANISHIGVGIMGKEGTQASLTDDLAIPKFRMLLILIHIQYSKVALNSFYNNIFLYFYNSSTICSIDLLKINKQLILHELLQFFL